MILLSHPCYRRVSSHKITIDNKIGCNHFGFCGFFAILMVVPGWAKRRGDECFSGNRYEHIHVRLTSAILGRRHSRRNIHPLGARPMSSLSTDHARREKDYRGRLLKGMTGRGGSPSRNCRQHGCCRQAYRDVFTACFGKGSRPCHTPRFRASRWPWPWLRRHRCRVRQRLSSCRSAGGRTSG